MTIFEFLKALPALIELFLTLKRRIDEAELEHRVADDIRRINNAFDAKDAAKLNQLFKLPS